MISVMHLCLAVYGFSWYRLVYIALCFGWLLTNSMHTEHLQTSYVLSNSPTNLGSVYYCLVTRMKHLFCADLISSDLHMDNLGPADYHLSRASSFRTCTSVKRFSCSALQ